MRIYRFIIFIYLFIASIFINILINDIKNAIDIIINI